MKKIWQWLAKSNRWKHLLGGIAIGLPCEDWYMAAYAGLAVGCAMEYKDYQHGGKPDWIDAALTLAGTLVARCVTSFIW